MKHITTTLAFALITLLAISCDQVVLPGSTGPDTGTPIDSTGGGTGTDTTGGGGGDTTRPDRDTNFVLVIQGNFVSVNGEALRAPIGAAVFVVWETGRDADIVYGQGEISPDRLFWKVRIGGKLPAIALFNPNGAGGVHGVGRVVIGSQRIPDRGEVNKVPNDAGFVGKVVAADVIFNTGKEKATPWTTPWIENFRVGYTMGISVNVGWEPTREDTFPLVITRR